MPTKKGIFSTHMSPPNTMQDTKRAHILRETHEYAIRNNASLFDSHDLKSMTIE
jgi:hypothetical protein